VEVTGIEPDGTMTKDIMERVRRRKSRHSQPDYLFLDLLIQRFNVLLRNTHDKQLHKTLHHCSLNTCVREILFPRVSGLVDLFKFFFSNSRIRPLACSGFYEFESNLSSRDWLFSTPGVKLCGRCCVVTLAHTPIFA
jgi:hypothetical protein